LPPERPFYTSEHIRFSRKYIIIGQVFLREEMNPFSHTNRGE
jgi:hypothetical protein